MRAQRCGTIALLFNFPFFPRKLETVDLLVGMQSSKADFYTGFASKNCFKLQQTPVSSCYSCRGQKAGSRLVTDPQQLWKLHPLLCPASGDSVCLPWVSMRPAENLVQESQLCTPSRHLLYLQ